MTAPMPTADELGPNDVFVQVHTAPDGQGRVQFTAYWLDDASPDGVRGQVFRADPAKFAAGVERRGDKVRHWEPKEGAL